MRSAVASTTGAGGTQPPAVVQNHPLRRGKHDGGRVREEPPPGSAQSCAPPWQARRGRVREEGCPVVQNHPLRRRKVDGGGRYAAPCGSAQSSAPPTQRSEE